MKTLLGYSISINLPELERFVELMEDKPTKYEF